MRSLPVIWARSAPPCCTSRWRGEGLPLDNHRDCGCLLYDTQGQDVQAGGSGAGCSAAVLCCKILPMLAAGQLRRVLFLPPAR